MSILRFSIRRARRAVAVASRELSSAKKAASDVLADYGDKGSCTTRADVMYYHGCEEAAWDKFRRAEGKLNNLLLEAERHKIDREFLSVANRVRWCAS